MSESGQFESSFEQATTEKTLTPIGDLIQWQIDEKEKQNVSDWLYFSLIVHQEVDGKDAID